MPFLSVIIPIYNTAMFLDGCLESVLSQKFSDIEVICVDDGSEDGSGAILDRWCHKDPRIKVIRQQHGGPSSARNSGLRMAEGRYVTFVDADDMVMPGCYSEIIPVVETKELDVLFFSFKTFPDGNVFPMGVPLDRIMDCKDLFRSSRRLQMTNSLCFCWRFVVRSSIIKDNSIEFDEEVFIGEDMIFNIEVLCHSKRIMAIGKSLYLHRTDNSVSLMNSRFHPKLESSLIKMFEVKKRQIRSYGLGLEGDYVDDLYRCSILVYLRMLISNAFHDPSCENKKLAIRHVLGISFIREAFNVIGFKNIYSSWKEYLFYLAQKFVIMPVIMRVYNREYGTA